MIFEGGEDAVAHCARIEAHQQPQYALSILKQGWLYRKGLVKGWEKRYFVLLSGDEVRSAVLRNFFDVPQMGKLQHGKDIILWDALGVENRAGNAYNWKNGEECFKLVHFYRNYRFCVPVNPSKELETAAERDEWVRLLKSTMVHAGITMPTDLEANAQKQKVEEVHRCCCKGPDPSECRLLHGEQLAKSIRPSKLGQPVCPSNFGYKYYERFGFVELPAPCVLTKGS